MKLFSVLSTAAALLPVLHAAENISLTEVPDYSWYAGCFGTASGNLMGYWDRHGFPDFYTGPTNDGLAPLDSNGANTGIRSLWASKAGFDGRPDDQPGHIDDYWTFFVDDSQYSYESTAPDPYLAANRPEHTPDCTCDFMGTSQNKWSDLDGECRGNIDAFTFNFWDHRGEKRIDFTPPDLNGAPVLDVQSGLRAWTDYRGYRAHTISQLADFNPAVPSGKGFTFADLKAEIDAGYPVILMLQNPGELFRDLTGMPHANPEIHAMVAYGYVVLDDGTEMVRYRTSWASGDLRFAQWGPQVWEANIALRGVILYHPAPKITNVTRDGGSITIFWDGPSSTLRDNTSSSTWPANWFALERADSVDGKFLEVPGVTADRQMQLPDTGGAHAFFRVKVLTPDEAGQPRG